MKSFCDHFYLLFFKQTFLKNSDAINQGKYGCVILSLKSATISGKKLLYCFLITKIQTCCTTWICSTGPSAEAVTLLSSIPWPLGTGLYSMTFSMPPRGLEDTMHGSPSEVGLQQSETRHVEGEQGRSRKISREELWIRRVASLVEFEVLHSNLITIHRRK